MHTSLSAGGVIIKPCNDNYSLAESRGKYKKPTSEGRGQTTHKSHPYLLGLGSFAPQIQALLN